MIFLHDDRTLLSPDALGGVLWLDVGGHPILHVTGDVLLHNVGTVVSEREKHQEMGILISWPLLPALFLEFFTTSFKSYSKTEREREHILRDSGTCHGYC